jgi:hypothetical protein
VPQHLYSVYIAFVHHVDVVCFSLQQELLAARSQQTLLALQDAGTTAAAKLQTLEDASSRASDGVLALHASLYRMGTVSAEVQEQLRGSVDSLSDAVRRSEREMQERVAAMLREHAASSEAISAQLVEARSSLGEISALSRRTGSFVGSVDALVHYASLFVLVLIVTSTTLTSASRIPALVVGIVCPVLLERYALSPALAVVCFFSRCCDDAGMARAHAQPNAAPVRNVFAILGALVVVFFALKHESPEVRQQRMLEEAIRGAFQAAAGAPSPRHHTASPPRLVDRSERVKEIGSDGETHEGEATAQASAALSPSSAGDDAPKTGAAKNGAGRKRK